MKQVLVISDVPVFKVNAGNRKCIKEYCDVLKELGANVTMLLISNHNTDKNDINISIRYQIFSVLFITIVMTLLISSLILIYIYNNPITKVEAHDNFVNDYRIISKEYETIV